ncbi:cytochrome b5 domain-containing protein [Lacrimispora indolis]|uniref:cytochrome b5 domain-containing protein n=1 Tax=Lacrimispora indolis TaxID=69825 RepID=UPI0004104CC8|nr:MULTISPECIES: cytochrome b5 domain-containing protein [Lachnospiraceae]
MELNLFLDYIGNCVRQINEDVERLYSDQYNSSTVLDHLSGEVIMLESHIKYFSQSNHLSMEEIENPYDIIHASQNQEEGAVPRYFTLDELSEYDGKNGAPAYVAVNGVVYDVTNNAVWRGDSHFGLNPGNDLTSEFQTCHPGAMVLTRLPIVGYLTPV